MSQIAIFGDLNCRILVTNYSNCLVKDVLRCIRMRQFADFAAQFAVFVVTLQVSLDVVTRFIAFTCMGFPAVRPLKAHQG